MFPRDERTKIADLHGAVRGEEHVGWLDIAMDDALLVVKVNDGPQDLRPRLGEASGTKGRGVAAEGRPHETHLHLQAARAPLRHHEVPPVGVAHAKERHHVRVVEPRDDGHFGLELIHVVLLDHLREERLDSNRRTVPGRPVHLTAAARGHGRGLEREVPEGDVVARIKAI